jgi:hypothetical protein
VRRGCTNSTESQLRLVVAESLIRLGERAEGKALCLQAAELAERVGADDLLGQAALVTAPSWRPACWTSR